MNTIKKAILCLFITLLVIIGLAQIVFGVDTGRAKTEAKLKKEMDNNSITLEIIPKNDEFEILEDKGDWYRVNYLKIKGYVKKEQVEVINKDNKENSQGTNLTNEQNQNTNEEYQNEIEQENKDTTEENTINDSNIDENNIDSLEQEEIKIGDKLYTKSELQVSLRPLPNSMKIETLAKKQEVTVVDVLSKWVYVSVNGKNGWIRKESLETTIKENDTEKEENNINTEKVKNNNEQSENEESNCINKTGYITTDGINFREKPNTDSKVLKTFIQNAKVTILLEEGNWYKVKHNDQEGYVLKTYVSEKQVTVTTRGSEDREKPTSNNTKETSDKQTQKTEKQESTENNATSLSKGEQIVATAKKYLGSRYVYGGASPSGFDCSGFTMYVYKQYGVSLPHSASAQSSKGTKVAKSDLQLGDIVFFTNYRTKKGIGHCGIYIGNGNFIHASTEKTGVIISSLNSGSHKNRYVTAIRIF